MMIANGRTFGGLPVKSVKEVAAFRKICIGLFGAPGTGKTTLAATCGDSEFGGRVVYLDAEGGSSVVSHRDDVDVIDIITWPQLEKVVGSLKTEQPWGTVVVDNMSEVQEINVKHVQQVNAGKAQFNDARAVYRESTQQIIYLVRTLRDMARNGLFNVVFIAWERHDTDEASSIVRTGVGMTPSLADKFTGVIDMVGYLSVENDPPKYTRVLDFAQTRRLGAKMRTGQNVEAAKIPLKQWNPSLATILDTVSGGLPWPHEKHVKAAK